MSRVGVLALQGGFRNHLEKLRALGVDGTEVRTPADLSGLDGLVLPGGESTTMMLGIAREGLTGPLAEFAATGKPLLATCAGAILVDDAHLSLLDITCERNAYGAQTRSFEAGVDLDGAGAFPGVFIRSPKLVRVGPAVEVVATLGDAPVGVREGMITAYTFHPELADDQRIHRRLLEDIATTTPIKKAA